MHSFSLAEKFVVVGPDKVASVVVNSPTVYQELERDFGSFKGHDLIAVHTFSEDWASWEMHPHGDETVVLLSGSATLIVKLDGARQTLTLDKLGEAVIIPRGAWHTAKVAEQTTMLFVTPGEGTQNEYDKDKI
jgi:mannose-6-phosphate isomerase-like protein (cupin superfamily)